MSSGWVEAQTWKTNANNRIEQYRKREVRLQITTSNNIAVPGTVIQVRQTRSRFAFGTAINGNVSNPQYAAFVKTNFEWAVMENESKWYANEPSKGNVSYGSADTLTNFCYANNITLRGHCLFWAVDSNVQSWVTNLSNAELLVALTNRLNSAVNHFKGTYGAWDVNNEMLHGNYYGNRLGDWVNSWMFKQAQALDPNLQLFVNDYNVISYTETDAYKQQILNLIASNAPVGGIGCQGHFGDTVNPTTTESRLDNLAQLGIPIWITEYDSVNADENVRADNLETLYRIAFSKPAVDGILMWGFWAGSHWRGSNAAIVNLNWTLNAAGRRYQSLRSEWTTVTNGVADANGSFQFRGFHGNYDLTLTPPGGVPMVRHLTLDPGVGTNVVTFTVPTIGPTPGGSPGQLITQCLFGQNAADLSLTVSNAGVGTLNYTLTTGAAWLVVAPTGGSSTSQPISHTISLATSNLVPGSYSSWVSISNISAPHPTVLVPVSVQVLQNEPTIGFAPNNLAALCLSGQNAQSLSFRVFNLGIGSLNYNLSNGTPWLAVTPTNGNSIGPTNSVWHTVSFITSNLPPGVYHSTVPISTPFQPMAVLPVALRVMTNQGSTISTNLPLIALHLDESTGTSTKNQGTAGGSLNVSAPVPAWSGNVPPNVGGVASVDFQTNTGNYYIESPTNYPQLTGLTKFTITGWANCRSSTEGSGGNRLVTWINSGGDGVDVVYRSDGSVMVGINQWPDSSPARSSAGRIPVDPSAGTNNWRFFAVTYDSTLASNHVKFYFGGNGSPATLDVAKTYARGATGTNIGRFCIGHFNSSFRSSGLNRMFRGLLDDVRVYVQELSLEEINAIQTGSPAIMPELHLDSLGSNELLLSWVGPNLSLQEATAVTGPWALRTNQAGAQILKVTGTNQFFRLQPE